MMGGPGAGRAKLRLSRGFPRGLDCNVTLYGIGRLVEYIDNGIHGGSHHTAGKRQKPPVRTEPHPTFRARPRSRSRTLARRRSKAGQGGFTSYGKTPKAPISPVPHPICAAVSNGGKKLSRIGR